MKYLVNLSYNGNVFYGYQIQKNKITVEGELEKVLSKIFNEKINTIASSRTDKGVHALNQYCTFESDKRINLNKLKNSINKMIDDNIYIKKIKVVNDLFNVRYDVIEKQYVYKINMGEYNPIEKDYVYQYNKKINKELLNKFILLMNGKHNFKSFTSDKDNNNYERDILIEYKINKNILYLTFKSSGFLRYMIRNIVGLLIDINEGKKNINDIEKIFNEMSRTSCGRCAYSKALYLEKIKFKEEK